MTVQLERKAYSPSQITCFLNEPALWVMRRRFGMKSEAGPGAWLGDSVHAGAQMALMHPDASTTDVLAYAEKTFHDRAAGLVDDDTNEAFAKIGAMMMNAIKALQPLGQPLLIEGWCETWVGNTLIRGRIDLGYSGEQPDVDIKTGRNCYQKPLPDHLIALSVYRRARKRPQQLLYVTTSKFNFVTPTDAELDLAEKQVERAVEAMEYLDSQSIELATRLCPPRDLTNFRWDDASRNKAKEIWQL